MYKKLQNGRAFQLRNTCSFSKFCKNGDRKLSVLTQLFLHRAPIPIGKQNNWKYQLPRGSKGEVIIEIENKQKII